MSSGENPMGINNLEFLNVSEEDMKGFAATGYAGADKLGNMVRFKNPHPQVGPAVYNLPDHVLSLGTGEDLQPLYDAFTAWKSKNDASKQQHEQYVKMSSENPGRAATVLTPPETKTVLA